MGLIKAALGFSNKKGSMNLRVSRDTFLYRNVTRTKKENKSSSDSDCNTGGRKF